ncbi:MAG: PPOX class F420-dependent oxidoreductase [Nitrososphaeraceae archaeon]
MIKSTFSEKEVEYIKSQRVARIATAAEVLIGHDNQSEDNTSITVQPDVVPVGFYFDGEYFYIGGFNMPKSTKYKNVLRNSLVALVIDDLISIKPWQPRGIRVYGDAEITKRQGASLEKYGYFETVYSIKITPRKKWSWGIETNHVSDT